MHVVQSIHIHCPELHNMVLRKGPCQDYVNLKNVQTYSISAFGNWFWVNTSPTLEIQVLSLSRGLHGPQCFLLGRVKA